MLLYKFHLLQQLQHQNTIIYSLHNPPFFEKSIHIYAYHIILLQHLLRIRYSLLFVIFILKSLCSTDTTNEYMPSIIHPSLIHSTPLFEPLFFITITTTNITIVIATNHYDDPKSSCDKCNSRKWA